MTSSCFLLCEWHYDMLCTKVVCFSFHQKSSKKKAWHYQSHKIWNWNQIYSTEATKWFLLMKLQNWWSLIECSRALNRKKNLEFPIVAMQLIHRIDGHLVIPFWELCFIDKYAGESGLRLSWLSWLSWFGWLGCCWPWRWSWFTFRGWRRWWWWRSCTWWNRWFFGCNWCHSRWCWIIPTAIHLVDIPTVRRVIICYCCRCWPTILGHFILIAMTIPYSGWCLIRIMITVCFLWWWRQMCLINGQFDFLLCIFQWAMRYAIIEVHNQTERHPNRKPDQCQYAQFEHQVDIHCNCNGRYEWESRC